MKRKSLFFWLLKIILAVIAIVIIYAIFFPLDKGNSLKNINTSSPAGSQEFLSTLSGLTGEPVQKGDPVKFVQDSNFLSVLLDVINNASSSIDITDYPWANGTFSDQVFEALTQASKRHVSVRVLLDSFGTMGVSEDNIKKLEQYGGKVEKYHQFSLLNPMQYDERDHMRTFVIDGKLAFVGGVGIVDYWIADADGYSQWNDFMVEVSGAMAQAVQEDFGELWTRATGEVLSGQEFYPDSSSKNTTNLFIPISSVPPKDTGLINDMFTMSVLSAQKKLYIINPFIIPNRDFLNALEEKAESGVDVRILSPGPITIGPILRYAWHADYQELLDAGVKIYEYQPSMIHAKMIMVDDIWSVVGSANMDNRSNALNAENVIGIKDESFATSLDSIFLKDLDNSKQITLSDWKKQYGFFSKLFSEALLIFYKQY